MKKVVVDQLSFGVLDVGTGRPIVLLHGFPLDHSMWNDQVAVLSDSNRVIVPDLRGHGSSAVTEGIVTMRQMADDVAALLSVLDVNEPVTLCGLSMGGYVAFEFWQHYGDQLDKLILCDSRAAADTTEAALARDIMAAQVLSTGTPIAADAMLPKLFAAKTYQDRPEIVDGVRRVILATDPRGIAATLRGMAKRTDMTTCLPDLRVPTLAICGAEDQITPPREMRALAAALPHAQYVEIAGAGHMAPLEQPAATNDAIKAFLTA